MNLQQLEQKVHQAVRRDDLQGEYKDYINEALADVQGRWNFACMEQAIEATMTTGTSSVRLPDDYKELLSRNASPIMLRNTQVGNNPTYFPVDIRSEAEVRRLNARFAGFSTGSMLPVWISMEDGVPFIRIDGIAGEDLIFRVRYYGYFPPLGGPKASNPITDVYPRMIYAFARGLAFESINDPRAQLHMAIYESEFKSNKATDVDSRYRGRSLRM
jgi:hypothetical protein